MKTGLVLGKFMPPHKGHEMLISFAYKFVDKLHILVDNIDDGSYANDYIPGEKRVAWLQKKFPNADVAYIPTPMPQDPNILGFWKTWKDTINQLVGYKTDYVIVGAPYGFDLAKNLGSAYVPVDIFQEMHQTSATNIRNNLMDNWQNLASFVKPDYLLKVAIIGPESSGKTTLTNALARQYQTTFVPEYARLYLEPIIDGRGIDISEMNFSDDDFLHIIKGQQVFESIQSQDANRILFADTDPLLTTLWYRWIMKKSIPSSLMELAQMSHYDLYLVTEPNIPWIKDSVRYEEMQTERKDFFEKTIELLVDNNRPYHVINSQIENRTEEAKLIIDELLKTKLNHTYFSSSWQRNRFSL